jgi:hypothetical protein
VGCTEGDKETESAEYAWGMPERIDSKGSAQEATELAVNAGGFAVAVWTDWDGEIWTNRYTPNDGWDTSERIETVSEGYVNTFPPPQVAVAQNGTAMLVWLENGPDAIWGSHFTPNDGWGPAEQIDRGFQDYGVSGPDVAMDADGNAIAVWRRSADQMTVVASRYTRGNGWGTAERIDDGSAGYEYVTRVAMSPNGSAIAVWLGDDGEGGRVFANQYTPTGGWQTSEAIDDSSETWAEGPAVAMDGSENGIVVWRQDYYGDDFSSSRITANRYTPEAGWGDAGPIEGDDQSYSYLPYISMNVGGTAVVVWTRGAHGPDVGGVFAKHYIPDSGWQTEALIEATYGAGSDLSPRVAVNAMDDALLVWLNYERTGQNVWSTHYAAGEGWDTPVRINLALWSSGHPQVGIDENGRGIAAWSQSTASDSGVFANRYAEGLGEDHSALWEPICDASCKRVSECSLLEDQTVAECTSECVDDLNRMPCDPNQAAADACVEELGELSCTDLENEYLPYVCDNVCLGDLLCEGRTCDDQNECTEDRCDLADGSCVYMPVVDGAPCASGIGTCQQGLCAAQFACTEAGILDAIALGGGPHTFACSSGGQRVTTTDEIVIDKSVILDGEGKLTVDGGDAHRVFRNTVGGQGPGGVEWMAELRRFEVNGGRAEMGGGILNEGTLVLTNSTVSGNTAAGFDLPEGGGGGIFNTRWGKLTLVNSFVSDNTAGGGPGGDIFGSGGGIYNEGRLTLTNTTLFGNTSSMSGGGLFNYQEEFHPEDPYKTVVTLTNSTVSGNTVSFGFEGGGGGIWTRGALILTNCTVSGNTGGAAISGGSGLGLSTLINSTVSGNTGAGLSGGFELISTTISGNSISGSGTSTNSLIDAECTGGSVTSQGGNIESPGNTCGLNPSIDQVNVHTEDVALGPLKNNGGPTLTRVPAGPAALDKIRVEDCVDADGLPLLTDQRGVERPQGSSCDVGAVEVSQ